MTGQDLNKFTITSCSECGGGTFELFDRSNILGWRWRQIGLQSFVIWVKYRCKTCGAVHDARLQIGAGDDSQ